MMTDPDLICRPIGLIRSPFKEPKGTPIQPIGARGQVGRLELDPKFAAGLKDLDGFSHLILLYRFHLSRGFELETAPFMDEATKGLFATRAPRRPNPIGLSVVRLKGVSGSVVEIEDVDVVDKTPLLDIKPFVPRFDIPDGEIEIGWLAEKSGSARETRADDRFARRDESTD